MGDNIANILMRLTGEPDDAEDTLESFLAKLQAFGKTEATAEADVSIGDGEARILALMAQLALFAQVDATADASVDVDEGGLAELLATVAAFEANDIDLDVDVNEGAALTQLLALRAAMQAVVNQDVELDIDTSNLQALQVLLRSIQSEDAEFNVDVNTDEGQAKLAAFLLAAQGVAHDINVDVDVDTATATAQVAAFMTLVQAADKQDIDIDVDVDKVGFGTAVVQKLASVIGGMVGSAQKVGSAIGGVTVNLGPFGVKLTAVTGAVLALAAAMVISLVSALTLLVSSLASATAAVGGLAVALVGALGPAVAVIGATITRIVAIVKAVKSQTEANKASAAGSTEAAAAEEKRHDAALAVAGAIRNVTQAERGLQQARDGARDAIVAANRDEVAASRALQDATNDVSRQFVEAHRAMEQAVEDVKDALLDLEGAEIGVDRTAIATERAKNKLAELRAESKSTSAEFDRLFNKFTDVAIDFDPSQLSGILPSGTSGDTQLDIADAILDVRTAKLNEKKATNELADSERDLSEKRQRAAQFAREGIAAFEPYTAAVRAQSDATERLSLATERSNELEQQGIDNAPAVIAASDSLKDAHDRLAEARHNLSIAAEGAAGGAAARKAKQEWDALTAAEQAFGRGLTATGTALRTAFQPAVESVLTGLGASLNRIPAILSPLEGSFTKLGDAMGTVINSFSASLTGPEISKSFITLIDGATRLTHVLGGRAFQAFFTIMMNIATGAMPLLLKAADRFATWLETIAGKTSNQKKLADSFAVLGEHLFGILGLVKQVGRIFLGFFSATSGQSKEFVGTITDMAKRLADFIGSAEGQEEIKDFFKDMVPLAIESIKFIGQAIVLILQIAQVLAPALTGTLKIFNLLLNVINLVVDALKPFLQVALQLSLILVGGLPKAVIGFLKEFRVIGTVAVWIGNGIGRLVTRIIASFSGLVSFIPTIFDGLIDFFSGLINDIGSAFHKLPGLISGAFQDAINAIGKLGKGFFDAGAALVQNIIDGIVSLTKDIGGVAGKVLGFLVDKLPGSEPKDKSSPLAGLADRGRAIMTNIASGIPDGANDLAVAMHRSLVPVVAGIDHNIQFPRPSASPAGVTSGGRGAINIGEVNLKGPGTELIDPTVGAAKFLGLIERAGGNPDR